MIKTLRNQSPILMAILLGVISLSFLVFFNMPTIQGLRGGSLGKIGGRTVSQEEFRMSLQSINLLGNNRGGQVAQVQAWHRLVFLDAAAALKVSVGDDEVAASIRSLPFLAAKDGRFDPANYDAFVKNYLAPRGIDEARFEQIEREQLLVEKVQRVLSAPARVAPVEIDRALGLAFGPVHLSIVRLSRADVLPQVTADAAAIDKEIADHGAAPVYRTPERRAVSWVLFPAPPAADAKAAAPAKGADDARQKAAQAAQNFAIDALAALDKAKGDPKAFAALAAEKGLAVQTTAPFAKGEAPAGLPPSPAFNRAAFELTTDVPVSDAVATDRGFLILDLGDVVASAPLPPEQLRPLAERNVRERLAFQELQKRGQALAAAVRQGVAAGKPFAAAVHDAAAAPDSGTPKAAAQSLPLFAPADPGAAASIPDVSAIGAVLTGDVGQVALPPGGVSDFVPTADGGFILFLEKRDVPDAAKIAPIREQAAGQALEDRRLQLLNEWFTAYARQPGYEMPQFLER